MGNGEKRAPGVIFLAVPIQAVFAAIILLPMRAPQRLERVL